MTKAEFIKSQKATKKSLAAVANQMEAELTALLEQQPAEAEAGAKKK